VARATLPYTGTRCKVPPGVVIKTKRNRHIGSTFESWLEETGIREEVTAAAVKVVMARQIAEEMKKQGIHEGSMK